MAYSTQEIAVFLPLVISLGVILITIVIHAFALIAVVQFVRYHHARGHTGVRFWTDVSIVACAAVLGAAAHLVEMAIWALLFVLCGQFGRLSVAFFYSTMFYTTLGAGTVMSPSWRLLGPFETADGMLMFGISTAIVVAVIQLLIRTKFRDLRAS